MAELPRKGLMSIANKMIVSVIAGSALMGMACSNKCFLSKTTNDPLNSGSVKKTIPSPATWPPASESPVPSKTISPSSNPKVETASGLDITPTGKSAIQPIGGQFPPPAPVADLNPNGVVQAQRLETVPAGKRQLPQTFPQSQDTPSNIPPLTPFPGNTGNSLVVPPPPPGSPLSDSAPLGIPSPPNSSPNR